MTSTEFSRYSVICYLAGFTFSLAVGFVLGAMFGELFIVIVLMVMLAIMAFILNVAVVHSTNNIMNFLNAVEMKGNINIERRRRDPEDLYDRRG